MKTFTMFLLTAGWFIAPAFGQRIFSSGHQTDDNRIPLERLKEGEYLPKTIICKIKKELRHYCFDVKINLAPMNEYLNAIGTYGLKKKFPHFITPPDEKNNKGEQFADLSLIYELKYTADVPVQKAISYLIKTGVVEYAEPHLICKLLYTPNDPYISSEYHLTNIQAYTGWDISKGDTSVVIGIVDTGTDTDHPDLVQNFKYNWADPVNGSDDDGDGYTDNFLGWDFEGGDNNPQVTTNDHGVHVAGDASAVTDNGTGVAAPGFKCKILPVRGGDANIAYGYDGIVYAADHGVKVINCSWGSSYGGSYGEDIVRYATINKDVLVVAGAGNDGVDSKFYPASYDLVISVTSTGSSDTRSSFSNYNYSVDVSAPGEWIYSSGDGGSYYSSSGTSMSSPVAAGCAAVVRAYFTSYNALQAGEQLKATSDNIDALHTPTYKEKLGKGRVNLYRALTITNLPSVVLTQLTINDNNDDAFVINDTMRISGLFTNYLAPTGNLTATLTAVGPSNNYLTLIDNSSTLGTISTLGTSSNTSDPFLVKIKTNAPLNYTVNLKLAITDGSYSANFYFSVMVNVDYLNITVNEISTSVTSKGLIGYNGANQTQGLGVTYKGKSLLFDASIMVGIASGPKVSDRARGDDGATADEDFTSVQNVKTVIPSVISDFDAYGIFNDNAAGTNKLNISVRHYIYAWAKPGHTKYVIFKYSIKNNDIAALNSLYAGIFADWDIMTYGLNKADVDGIRNMGYCYSTEDSGLYAGIQLLSPGTAVVYSIDNDGGNGSMNIYDGYTTAEKYQSMSTTRQQGGGTGTGADVSQVVSAGPFNIAAGDSVEVAFALLAGDDLVDLQKSADSAYMQYPVGIEENENGFANFTIYPNPSTGVIFLDFSLLPGKLEAIDIIDVTGKIIWSSEGKYLKNAGASIPGAAFITPGVYMCKVRTSSGTFNRPFVIAQ